MQEKVFDLFEYLRERAGCEFINDLPKTAKINPRLIIHAIASIHPNDFLLRAWNDALNYLVQAPAQETAEEAYALLIFALSAVDAVR